ncbi:MAG: hypothetical protein A2W25_17360 [candidate division Zixibacteria bacterium RBG_16_53_22]|nr:MAG: hypothetical protein A2W25_17360 [candidate division Zixibacteria bacterium RBG_16_53_22]
MFEILLGRLASALKKAKIDYMVIGGQAVLIHGEPRYTKDIDVTLGVDTDKLPELIKLSKGLGLRVLVKKPEEFVRDTKVLPAIQISSNIKVDFIFSSAEFEREAIKRAKSVKIGRTAIKFASLEDLVILKIIAGRPRDIEDVRILLIKNPRHGVEYIRAWLRKFDAALDADYSRAFANILNEINH